jgi:polysaccharide chain length determinant protein (PEP-CTERM system associated)
MTTPAPDEPTRGPGLGAILEIVRRRRTLALLPFAFVLAVTASLAIFLPSLWTASALVLVTRPQVPEAFVRSTVDADLEGRLLTLSHEILDAPRLGRVIETANLYPAERAREPMVDVVDRMRRDIRIELVDDGDRRRSESRTLAFTVAYTAPDPEVAARVSNTLAALFIEENSRQRERQAVGTSQFLEGQLGELRQRLTAQERRITEYKERHLGELPEQREVNLRALERLQAQLSLAQENQRRAGERRTLITQSLNDLDVAAALAASASTGPAVTPADTAAARLSVLRQELAALQTTYSDKYPDVIHLQEQIRILESRAKAEEAQKAASPPASAAPKPDPQGGRLGRDLRLASQNPYVLSLVAQADQAAVEAKATAEEITKLNRQIAVYQQRLENTPKREQELALITRDYETTRETFRSLLAKRGEADMAAELEQRQKSEQFRVIEPARWPESPTGPNRLRLLLVGLVLALGAAGAAVVIAEQVDTSFRRADEVRAAVALPVLSTIPRIVTEDDRRRARRQHRMAVAAVAVGLLAVIGTTFAVAHDNQSLVSLLAGEPAAMRR